MRTDKAQQVVALVEEKRIIQPKIGGKKLYFMLKKLLKSLHIGRDKFFDILRANHLLIVPKRSYHVTTNSHHRFRKHKNMILDYQITKPNQVWVAINHLFFISQSANFLILAWSTNYKSYFSILNSYFALSVFNVELKNAES
ncbi:hypothetical protein AB670_01129 [Chryseobacterium sp. MOF25P]|uniref:hypothetical protein n=1 Tax=unclassified Chryseobacterium TaxID=2593645 RepID=UPI000804ED97|nr:MULTISPECIES: hypothetical protein [unclassified Chryseobacterium]OBW42489.1 hypothetical protein AB670_01129 [Chryseobacterium sp. MOF25P]OBW46548.1 hypothetical protein AB671_01325 [Chryseobacterium sp. BGARF1]